MSARGLVMALVVVGALAPTCRAAAEDLSYLRVGFQPQADAGGASAAVASGYDAANRSLVLHADFEASLYRWLAVRGGIELTSDPDRQRPFVGARARVLAQADDGLDGSVGLSYQPDGIREAEGRVELAFTAARRFEAARIHASLAYAQDPENDDRQVDAQLAALAPLSPRFHLGAAGRVRADLFSDDEKRRPGEPDLELVLGPVANVCLGAFALFAQVGLAGVRTPERGELELGLLAVGGVGATF